MELFVLGTSQAVAPAAVRERLHVDLEEVYRTLADLLRGRGLLAEAVPLSTCARLELYGVAPDVDRAARALLHLLGRRTGVAKREILGHTYVLRDTDAVRHLFRVASGLDSVVHGEAQILGQVREAAHHPLLVHSKGPVLHRLFESALATGKKVRTETEIGRGAASLASAALSLVQGEIGRLEPVTALVLGAGETGTLVARLLHKAKVGRLVIANRTEETARLVAAGLGAEARSLAELPALLAEADLIVGAVGGGGPLVTPELVASVAPIPGSRTRYYLDLAHPRSVDPAVGALPGTRLFDLESVFEEVEEARRARATQTPRAERIVDGQAMAFARWQRSRGNVPVLRAVRAQVLEMARDEAERLSRGRSDEERRAMTRFARTLARTLLHQPTVALRDADPASVEGRALLESAGRLFGVAGEGSTERDLLKS